MGGLKTGKGYWEQYVGRRVIRGKDGDATIYHAYSGVEYRGKHSTLKKAQGAAEWSGVAHGARRALTRVRPALRVRA
jgi:hypothetical protein